MRHALARFRRRTIGGIPAPDVALAGALCVVAVLSVLTGNPAEGPLWIVLPVAVTMTVALLWRRRHPVVPLAVITVAGFVQTLSAQTPGSLWSLAVYAVAVYSVAAWSSEAIAAITGATFVAALLVEERIANGVDYVFILLLFGGVWLLGRASRYWRGRVTAAERREQEAARLAAAEERLRIARDLHDVVAHSLGAIAVQADAAEAALHAAPARAVEPVQAIQDTAREALADIRRVLDLLRAGDDGAPEARSPGAAQVPELVSAARGSGMRIDLDLRLNGDPIPPAIDVACYRIVQEALTNVRKHAGAAAEVEVVQRPRELVVRIANGTADERASAGEVADTVAHTRDRRPAAEARRPAADGSGYGIRGMAERVRALGGVFTVGGASDEGFAVQAVLPLTSQRRSRA